MTNLTSTYRIQFHKDFNFEAFEKIIPYLKDLGIGTVYASPVFKSVPGSNHGYDGLDPHQLNPETGSDEQLKSISKNLKASNIQWLQDIVPNHMAFDHRNEWLMDVLEKGPQSVYARFFDTSWSGSFYQGRLMVPFLGADLDEVIDKKELVVEYRNKRFVFTYYGSAYPLQPLSYEFILKSATKQPAAIKQLIAQLPKVESKDAYGKAWEEFKMQLAGLLNNEKLKTYVETCLKTINLDKEKIKKIESQQSYRLCSWQETNHTINYRRFFTVNGLICLNMQDEFVFDHYHQMIKSMVDEGMIQGLRIDHIDGLYDPTQYLQRLRDLVGDDVPVLVEKILEPGESLPANWPVDGNTGYDFLGLVNNLFTSRDSEKAFTRFYREIVNDSRAVHEMISEKKSAILYGSMSGELDNLFHFFIQQNLVEKKSLASIRPEELKEVIAEFLVHCPVYRFYGNDFPLNEEEAWAIRNIFSQVKKYNPDLIAATEIFEKVLLEWPLGNAEDYNTAVAEFYKRCMQFSGPLMAKGVEDTLMYTYNRFIAHNDVGDAPGAFGIPVESFHQAMAERQHSWPLSLNATSTHDTKRGEDVRARLNVLSDLGEEWMDKVKEWEQLSKEFHNNDMPSANDRYFIYQTIAGAHPFPGEHEDDFSDRILAYLEKALREAKMHSDWASPDQEYEKYAKEFALVLLNKANEINKNFNVFLDTIVDHGIINSLNQLILKFTCPGIPDVYQGCELWDLSLVDPDNRRAVDFNKRQAWLQTENDILSLWNERYNGRIKLWLTQQLFQLRKQQPWFFTSGEYLPLRTSGTYKDKVIAFARKYRNNILMVVLPLHTAAICKEQGRDILNIDWKDTIVEMPGEAKEQWIQLTTGKTETGKNHLKVSALFETLPMAILRGQLTANERGAGILLHISSLPSLFGIGDMGPEAMAFADFLQTGSQKYWQLLPVNPTEAGQGHSPYSSISSRAGNILFISPELLVKEGLLSHSELHAFQTINEGTTNYGEAEKIRAELFEMAWRTYSKHENHSLKGEFEVFELREKEWLDDFAYYVLLKQKNGGKPWFEWEDAYKFHDREGLSDLESENRALLLKIKWLQFIFSKQWHALKDYCNRMDIRLIGDLPFYVSYDSADVWAHRHLFALDEMGNRTGIAGVPPDAFSADGQLWGMPVFNWEAHQQENYAWWVNRLKKNIEMFDVVRLDHFRAFSAYWDVPAGESTAKNGVWKPGPGEAFFKVMEKELGELPFVAEDLGEIDEPVYQLRDHFQLPGMKVLQFAFGSNMNKSVHIPHNYKENFLVYTGTHDNNTTRGWFTTEAGEDARLSLERYVGRPVSSAEVSMVLSRMAFGSVARVVILPLQDVLNLDGSARMNTPASSDNNWAWRLRKGQVNAVAAMNLRNWTRMYNRE